MAARTKKDIIEHVTGATGVAREDVGKVVDAAFAYLRQNALQGTDVEHPSLGRIRVRTRDAEGGASKPVYRYQPDAKAKATAKGKSRKRAGRAGEDA